MEKILESFLTLKNNWFFQDAFFWKTNSKNILENFLKGKRFFKIQKNIFFL